jgi:hypothetical protein
MHATAHEARDLVIFARVVSLKRYMLFHADVPQLDEPSDLKVPPCLALSEIPRWPMGRHRDTLSVILPICKTHDRGAPGHWEGPWACTSPLELFRPAK